jgi:acyl-coenzyme A synthetase/AMP-(fatty) acid ligase
MNAAELLLSGHEDSLVALECAGERVTRGELRARVARRAGVLQRQGLREGEAVAIRLADGIGWVEAWLAAIWAGGVAAGVNPRLPATEWQATLEQAQFKLVLDELAEPGVAQPPNAAGAPVPAAPRADDAPAFWVYSSGTSGTPKAVVHAQRAVTEIARVSGARLGLGRGDRLFAPSRLFFTYPLVNGLLAGLRLGATLLIDPAWPSAAGVAAFVHAHRPSALFAVPAMLRALLQEGLAEGLRGCGLRLAVSAGEALPSRLRSAWTTTTGVPLWDGWGTSETLVLALTAGPHDTALRASPGIALRALDEAAAARGEPTRLELRCATLAIGYHGRAAAEALHDGVFAPADLFVREGEGPAAGWRFAGREDSLVKLRGRWVDLVALEDQLATGVQGLREAALACTADADGLAQLRLFFSADDEAGARAELAARAAALPPHRRPACLIALPALPRTATGKLLRRALAGAPEEDERRDQREGERGGEVEGERLWHEDDGLHIDVRRLWPPQPMTLILRHVRQAPPGAVLIAHLDRDPLLLYPELLVLGWWADPLPSAPGEVRLRLARVGAAAAS